MDELTFNSPSRDHSPPRSEDAHTFARFQLPLSGSQEDYANSNSRAMFRSFNSLSRDHFRISEDFSIDYDDFPFNSLSRDHGTVNGTTTFDWQQIAFNSLSRDHRARFRDFSALRGFLPRHLFAQMIPKTTIWLYRFAPL